MRRCINKRKTKTIIYENHNKKKKIGRKLKLDCFILTLEHFWGRWFQYTTVSFPNVHYVLCAYTASSTIRCMKRKLFLKVDQQVTKSVSNTTNRKILYACKITIKYGSTQAPKKNKAKSENERKKKKESGNVVRVCKLIVNESHIEYQNRVMKGYSLCIYMYGSVLI